MTDTLQNNCKYISKKNKTLAEKLQSVQNFDKNLSIELNFAGEYNLTIDGIPVHSLTGAVEEAKDIALSTAHNDYGTLHVIYGIGLGYLADEFIQSLKGKVIVYEPDIQTLAFVLSAVDLSQSFDSERLFFASNFEELKQLLYKLYRFKSNVTFSYLDYYKGHGNDFDEFNRLLRQEIILIEHNYTFQVNNTRDFFYSTLKRLAQKYKLKQLTGYKNALKNVPAIIASAGPSLSKNIDFLKKYQNKAVIFSVGTALSTLYNNGITPDFLNVIEKINTSHHYNLPFSKDIAIICEQFSEPAYLDIPFKEKFITSSLENDDARWFLEKAELPFIDFETKGTVAYHALYCAYYLGCSPIILLGQDLAYSDGECYSKGSKFEDLSCIFDTETQSYKIIAKDFDKFKDAYCASVDWAEEKKVRSANARLRNLNQNLVTVKGQNNNLLPTDSVYSLFINYLQDFAQRYKEKESLLLVNASTGGALIQGFDIMPFEDAIKQYVPENYNKTESMKNFYNIKKFSGFDTQKVKKNLLKDIDVMNTILKIATPAAKQAEKLVLICQNQENTSEAQNLLNKIVSVYVRIVNDYMLKYRIIKILTAKEYSDVAYLTRENPAADSAEVIKNLAAAYNAYFQSCIANLDKTIKILNDVIKELEN